MRPNLTKIVAPALVACLVSVLSACQYADPDQVLVTDPRRASSAAATGSILGGEGGIKLFGAGSDEEGRGGGGIGVNSHLWRASLDTLSFMPLTSADPFGGVIITDWYTPPETPNERFKMTVYILARTLRADGLRVAVFRQEQRNPGVWTDSSINLATITSLENKILERARQLRTSGIGN